MYAEERQQAIAALVTKKGRMSVVDLAAEYDVTTETVRRDLSTLERLSLLRRVHGGAVSSQALTVLEAALSDRAAANPQQKEHIAEAALRLLPPNDATILMDAGSTTARLAEVLPRDRRFTVITHAVPVAMALAGMAHVELHLLPGRVRRATQAAVGYETVAAIDQIRADIAFLGTNGISLAHGLSTPDRAEAAVKTAMVNSAHRSIVLADATKIGIERTVRFASLAQLDALVTDAGISSADRIGFETAGLEVLVA